MKDLLEQLLPYLAAIFGGGNILQFIQNRQLKTLREIEAIRAVETLYKERIENLNKSIENMEARIEKLEKLACFNNDCPKRV